MMCSLKKKEKEKEKKDVVILKKEKMLTLHV